MLKDKADLVTGELIGLNIKVTQSTNKDSEGISGVVIDETKNMLTILDKDGKRKEVIKKQNTFTFTKNQKQITINGNEIGARPEERTKKWLRK